MIDTHFHPPEEKLFEAQLEEAVEAGVKKLVAVGSELTSSKYVNELAEKNDMVYATTGVHPHEAGECNEDFTAYEKLFGREKNCAVGEIGLDYYYENSEREAQKKVFKRFINFGAQFNLPLVIHCRDAYRDCLHILKRELKKSQKFEIHSCTGPPEWVDEILNMGGYVGFNGLVTFKNAANVRESLERVPLDKLLLETDAPYLAPVPYRGKKNRPALVKYVAHFIAEYKGLSLEELIDHTNDNASRFFPGL